MELTKTTLNQKVVKLENELLKEKEEVQKKQHLIEKYEEEQVKFERNAKLYEAQKKNYEDSISTKEAAINQYLEEKRVQQDEAESLKNKINQLDRSIANQRNEYDIKCGQLNLLDDTHKKLLKKQMRLEKNEVEKDVEIREMRGKIQELEKKNKDLNRFNNSLTNDKDRFAREKKEAEFEKNLTKNGVNALTREIEHLRRDTDVDKKKIIDLIRFRDMMSKSIKKAEEENVKNKEEISKKNNDISMLKEQGRAKQESIADLLKQIFTLEKDRDRFSHEASKANANLMQMVEEVKLKKNLISELKKENFEFEGKLKQQQNLYEAVRSDRNLYSKNLIEAQDEVAELRRKFKIASHQIS